MPKFSVLMSVYKNENPEYLKQAIESILTQTLLPNEIVIVKDGLLTKELDEIIEKYSRNYHHLFNVVAFSTNRGLGLALRDGVLICNYEYIARMDTDDICKPTRFEKQIEYFEKNPDVELLGTWIEEFSKDENNPETITKLPYKHDDIKAFAQKRNPFRHMTIMFKKNAVIESGNYRDFLWFEDYDLWVRMIIAGVKTANIPEILVSVRADKDMFKRRGGLRYLEQEIKFQKFLLNFKFINNMSYIRNIVCRGIVRLVPNNIRVYIYKCFLRN